MYARRMVHRLAVLWYALLYMNLLHSRITPNNIQGMRFNALMEIPEQCSYSLQHIRYMLRDFNRNVLPSPAEKN